MTTHLVVVRAFGGLARGELVCEEDRVAEILASENAAHVVRIVAPANAKGKD